MIEAKETLSGSISGSSSLNGNINTSHSLNGNLDVGVFYSDVDNYEELENKPQINGIELIGNKTLEELGIKQEYTANDVTFEDGATFQEKYNSGELKGEQGIQGIQGIAGKDGTNGKDGYTPIKGTDYYTEADKQEMVQLVLNSLPNSNEVSY